MLALPAAASEVAIRISCGRRAVAAWWIRLPLYSSFDREQFHSSRRRRGRIEGCDMTATLGFDIYGTPDRHRRHQSRARSAVGDRAARSRAVAHEAARVRLPHGLMQRVPRFGVCTREALGYCCLHFRRAIPEGGRDALMDRYPALRHSPTRSPASRPAGRRLPAVPFSMGRRTISMRCSHTRARRAFRRVVSLQAPRLYKPGRRRTSTSCGRRGPPRRCLARFGNPFDVLGAVGAGINGAWVKRSPDAVLDPWEITPTSSPRTCRRCATRCAHN